MRVNVHKKLQLDIWKKKSPWRWSNTETRRSCRIPILEDFLNLVGCSPGYSALTGTVWGWGWTRQFPFNLNYPVILSQGQRMQKTWMKQDVKPIRFDHTFIPDSQELSQTLRPHDITEKKAKLTLLEQTGKTKYWNFLSNIFCNVPSSIWSTVSNALSTSPCSNFLFGSKNELCLIASCSREKQKQFFSVFWRFTVCHGVLSQEEYRSLYRYDYLPAFQKKLLLFLYQNEYSVILHTHYVNKWLTELILAPCKHVLCSFISIYPCEFHTTFPGYSISLIYFPTHSSNSSCISSLSLLAF